MLSGVREQGYSSTLAIGVWVASFRKISGAITFKAWMKLEKNEYAITPTFVLSRSTASHHFRPVTSRSSTQYTVHRLPCILIHGKPLPLPTIAYLTFQGMEKSLSLIPRFGVISSFQSVRVRLRLRLDIRLSEDFVECIRLLDSQETNSENEKEGEETHNDSPYSHGKKEKRDEEIHHVASTEGEKWGSKCRVFQPRYYWRRCFNRHTQHDQAEESDQGSN